jgi:two-component sensor histidine kinase
VRQVTLELEIAVNMQHTIALGLIANELVLNRASRRVCMLPII